MSEIGAVTFDPIDLEAEPPGKYKECEPVAALACLLVEAVFTRGDTALLRVVRDGLKTGAGKEWRDSLAASSAGVVPIDVSRSFVEWFAAAQVFIARETQERAVAQSWIRAAVFELVVCGLLRRGYEGRPGWEVVGSCRVRMDGQPIPPGSSQKCIDAAAWNGEACKGKLFEVKTLGEDRPLRGDVRDKLRHLQKLAEALDARGASGRSVVFVSWQSQLHLDTKLRRDRWRDVVFYGIGSVPKLLP